MRKLLLLLLLFMFNRANACLNGEILSLKSGLPIYEDHQGYVPWGHNFFIQEETMREGILKQDALYRKTKDLDYLSDKGLLLILLKQYDEAIRLYLEIEKIEPGRYSTASNIGTAYELMGKNESASHWIKKAVEIDSSSHNNSEWIHVKILEAKIKGDDFIISSFLLNTDFGKEVTPVSKLSGEQLRKLRDALYYQLNERISFVKPEDKILAQLLFDLGNVSFLMKLYSDALEDYKKAKEFGLKDNLVDARINKLSAKPSVFADKILSSQPNNRTYFIGGAVVLLLVVIVTVFIMRRRS